jgi:hypothetical protein
MEPYEWDPENYDGEDYPFEWSDGEATPFSPGRLLARRFYPPGRRPGATTLPARRPTSAVPASAGTSPAAALERIRQLDERQRATTTQLALLQQRTSARQTSDQFGPMATGAVAALALGAKSGDLFSPAIIQGLPLAQLLLQTRGRAITAGFNSNPWTTLGFPAAALLLAVFRNQIPGLAPKIVPAPDVSVTDSNGTLLVLVKKSPGVRVTFTEDGRDPVSGDRESGGVHRVAAGNTIKLRAFIAELPSEVVTVTNPKA